MANNAKQNIASQPSPGLPSLTVYRVSISRGKLKRGDYRADQTEVLRETILDAREDERFYDPALALLDRISRERGGDQH